MSYRIKTTVYYTSPNDGWLYEHISYSYDIYATIAEAEQCITFKVLSYIGNQHRIKRLVYNVVPAEEYTIEQENRLHPEDIIGKELRHAL